MRTLGALLGLTLLAPFPAQGQLAVNGGVGLPWYLPGTTYESRYSPPFPATPHTGAATQELQLDPVARPLLWGGIEWLPHPNAGLTIRATFRRSPLGGINTPYHLAVTYSARQPPDSVERQYELSRDTSWPETTGHLRTFGVDALATFASPPGRPLRVRVGGGVSLVSVSGSFEPVGLTTMLLGGHAVLFTNEYHAVLDVPRAWTVSPSTSAQVAIALGSHASLDVGLRVVLPRTVSVAPQVTSVIPVNAVQTITVSEAQQALAPAPLGVRLGTVDVIVGIRVGR